eukprot:PITA_17267
MGYVEGRQILDNIIQAHEMVYSLITNKQAGMIIQIDIAKAYDKLSWSYIREILKSYGFDYNWIKWGMALVTTASCLIILNGSPSKTFKPSRGLRKGDPLSPFLFILMMEGLGRAIRPAKEEGRIQGLRLTQYGDTVTHQQFVDDTMLQGTPTVKEAKAFKQILSEFARAAGTEGKGEEKKKWALVAWDMVCKPKSHGGLGLHDLGIINRVLGAKIWWRWLKEIQAPYAKLWKQKYAREWQEKNLIRMTGQVKGSVIWNRAWENRALIQNHSFWENRNGNLAWFLEDNWQQEDNLRSEELADIHIDTINKGLRWVSDYWDQSRNNGKWITWKLLDYSGMGMLHTQAIALKGLLYKRKILNSTLDDQLRWGKNKIYLFNIKEAKRIDSGLNLPNTDQTWK